MLKSAVMVLFLPVRRCRANLGILLRMRFPGKRDSSGTLDEPRGGTAKRCNRWSILIGFELLWWEPPRSIEETRWLRVNDRRPTVRAVPSDRGCLLGPGGLSGGEFPVLRITIGIWDPTGGPSGTRTPSRWCGISVSSTGSSVWMDALPYDTHAETQLVQELR